ncbi:MAG: glycosyltransferase [Bacteroidales bacterium]|nr:glycosyltransferase [Lentimicrobiaceae bacterium]MDD5695339.1 glycosyltransferase [Bacteroidales bacterium]
MGTDRKKIVIIGPAYPLRGGLATFNERLARELLNQGHEAILYTFSLQYPGFLFPGKTQLSGDPRPEGLDIRERINSIHPLNWLKVGREISRIRPTLVIIRYWMPFMGPCLGTIARIIRRNRISRIITLADNIIPHERRFFDRWLTTYYLKSSDGFLFMSRAVMNDLDHFPVKGPRKYCPHPLYDTYGDPIDKNTARKALSLDDNCLYLLFFGFIRDYKGLDILLHALAEERLKTLPIRLIIAGEYYTDRKPYEQLIDQLQIRDKVIAFNDFIPNAEVAKFFCAADLIVQPYKSATQSGVTQIAYHFNKPMVITNVGGLAEMVPDGRAGYVVNPDPRELAGAIADYVEHDRERDFSSWIEKEKKKYSWNNMIVHIFAVEEEIVHHKP